jgi:hypothetical protein
MVEMEARPYDRVMGTGTPQDAPPPLWLRWWRGLLRRGAGWLRRHVFERGDFKNTGRACTSAPLGNAAVVPRRSHG